MHQTDACPRVALVTNILSHYRVPCFAELAARLPGQVTFFMLAEKMAHRGYVMAKESGDIPAVPLKGWGWSHPPYDDLHINDVRPILNGGYDTIILGAWDEPTYVLLWLWGVATGRDVLFWIESTAYDMPRAGLKERYKRALLRGASGCIVPGKRAAEYCQDLGMAQERIFLAPNATDRRYFSSRADELLPRRDALRAQLGLSGTVVLFVGRFVESYKDVMTLIRAAADIQRSSSVNVVLAGEGPDRSMYEKWISANDCRNVRFTGELDHDTLCNYYAAADAIALTSKSEAWGFVLNEAMEFHLPVIVSEAVGAGPDLVKAGENGFVVPTGCHRQLAEALTILDRNIELRTRMGERSKQIIARFSPERWASGALTAIQALRPQEEGALA